MRKKLIYLKVVISVEMFDKLLELSKQGFYCSQILILLVLESEGKENPDLVRALGGLVGGLGFSGRICGALTGGCCLISYFAGKGEIDEIPDEHCNEMITKLVGWFEHEYGEIYGSCDCNAILENNPSNKLMRCPQIVEDVYIYVMEMLTEYDLI